MKTFAIVFATLLLLSSCASQKAEEATPPPIPERDFKLDYVLIDASEGDRPRWILNPHVADSSDDRGRFRYFVSEADHSNKRLSMKSAKARASARIAGEITQFIKNTYSEAVQGSDDDVTEYMQEQLTQEIQSFIVGAETKRTYWEKRRYKKELGAPKDKSRFVSYALVRMKKTDLAKMIAMARKKILRSIESPVVKKKTERAIYNVEEKFNALERPVAL